MTKRPKHRPYCDDWACPSLWSCARAWGRSWPYWRFDIDADEREGVTLYRGPRNPRYDACEDYERGEIQPWMLEAFKPARPMERPLIPSDFRLHLVQDIAGDCEGET